MLNGLFHLQNPVAHNTCYIIRKIQEQWSVMSSDPDILMLWVAAVLCFFGFFRSGEITVPSQNAFDPRKHLSWGDIAVDNQLQPTMLRVMLKHSKTDQLGKGVEVYVCGKDWLLTMSSCWDVGIHGV